jgi:hypothetical protein
MAVAEEDRSLPSSSPEKGDEQVDEKKLGTKDEQAAVDAKRRPEREATFRDYMVRINRPRPPIDLCSC